MNVGNYIPSPREDSGDEVRKGDRKKRRGKKNPSALELENGGREGRGRRPG